jgi:hypothetical protein
MADLSYAQLKRVWLDGAKGTKWDTNAMASLMAAIAEAESSGDPSAYNPNDNGGTQTSWGLWQLSNGTHSPVSSQWSNPVVNAQLAVQKLDSQGLGAWGTYDSGAYKAYLSDGTTAAPPGAIPATGGQAGQGAIELTAAQQAEAAGRAGTCALGFDKNIGFFFGLVHADISFCVIAKPQVRAVLGGMLILSGSGIMLAGLAVLIATTTGLGPGPLRKLATGTQGAARKTGLASGGGGGGGGSVSGSSGGSPPVPPAAGGAHAAAPRSRQQREYNRREKELAKATQKARG